MEPSYLRDPFYPVCKEICPQFPMAGGAMMMCEPCLSTCNAVMTQLTTTDAGLQQLMAAAQQAQQQMMPPAAAPAGSKPMMPAGAPGGSNMAMMAHSPRGAMMAHQMKKAY